MKSIFKINPMDEKIKEMAQDRLNNLTKPVGSFASLEVMVVQAAGAQGKEKPDYPKKAILSFSDNDASESLKVLANYAGASLRNVATESDLEKQAENLALDLVNEGIGIVGISLVDWDESEVYPIWEILRDSQNDIPDMDSGDLADIKLASILYQAAAAQKILIMLDGPASLLAAIVAARKNPVLKEYLVCSRDGSHSFYQEMQQELGLTKGMRTEISGDGGLSAAFGLTLFDAAIRTTQEIATFAEAAVQIAYNAPVKK